jgi:hypothetical protein
MEDGRLLMILMQVLGEQVSLSCNEHVFFLVLGRFLLWIHLSHGFAVLDDVSIGDRQRILDIHFNPGT